MIRRFLIGALIALLALPTFAQSTGGGGGSASGAAGGDLSGTYPNPTVAQVDGVATTTPTGTGAVVFNNGPTLIAPALGTPASGNLANTTGYPNATSSTFGLVKPDNSTITITAGVISSTGGGSGCTVAGTVNQAVSNNGSTGCQSSSTTITTAGVITDPAAGAASAPALSLTGAPFTGGSMTSNVPLLYCNQGSAPTTFSANGTEIGCNAPSGFTGNFIDFHLNGGVSLFSVNINGGVTSNNAFINPSTGVFSWASRGQLTSPAAGGVQLGAADAAAPVAQTLSVQSVIATTANTAGANTLINGSKSTGSGAGGSITLQTTSNTAASTTQNTEVPVLTLDSSQHGTFGNTTNAPTCGTGCSSISATSTDQRMTVTSGAAVTSVTVNFGKTWVNVPVCISETNSATDLSAITAISASAVTVTVATAITSGPVYLICQ